MAQERIIEPLTDDELLAVADDPELSLKFTSEERRRLTRIRPQAAAATPSLMSERTWADTAVDALPTVGGALGGIVGGIGGTVGGFGVGGIPGALGGATLGGGAGEAVRQLVNRSRGKPAPATMGEAAIDIGQEGAIQGVVEAGGGLIGKAARGVGRSLVENAVRPPITLVKEFPDVIETILKERLPVGRSLIPGLRSGSQQAKALLRDSSRTTRGILKAAGEEGTRFNPQQVAASKISDLATKIMNQPISGPDLRRLSAMTTTYLREHGESMTPQALKDMKQAAQVLAKPVFKAQQAGGSVTADQAIGARFNEAVASGGKEALETISGIASSEARTKNLIGATRAIRQAELRRLPLAAEGISGAAAVVGSLLQPNSGLDTRLRNGAVAWLAARGLTSPRSISRQGLILTATQTRELLRQFPRLGMAVAQELSEAPGAGDQ